MAVALEAGKIARFGTISHGVPTYIASRVTVARWFRNYMIGNISTKFARLTHGGLAATKAAGTSRILLKGRYIDRPRVWTEPTGRCDPRSEERRVGKECRS